MRPRPPIKRLGKIRGAILDVLDAAGGSSTVGEICEALHRSRPWDLKRRVLPDLEDAGIISVDGDTVTLAADWLDRLEEQRQAGKEAEADELARLRLQIKRQAYHSRHKVKLDHHHANVGADGHIEDLKPEEVGSRVPDLEPPVSSLAAAVRDYLDRNPHDACQPPGWIGATLWTYELYPGKPTPAETRAAIDELGGETYLRERLEAGRGAA